MDSVLLAESAILLHFETVGVVLLVFHGVVVSLLALRASQCDFHAHYRHLLNHCLPVFLRPMSKFSGYRNYTVSITAVEKWAQKNSPFFTGTSIVPQGYCKVNSYFRFF